MALDAYAKQQLRQQAETSLEEVYRWQTETLKVVSEYTRGIVHRQYQIFHRIEAKRLENKAIRRNKLKTLKEKTKDVLDKIPVLDKAEFLKPVVDFPFAGLEFLDEQLDQQFYKRLDQYLNTNRVVVDKVLEQAFLKLQKQQDSWRNKVKEQLATRFPVSEEEHLALAKDITHLVRRIETEMVHPY